MDIDEINDHIHKLKCGSTDWQSVEKACRPLHCEK